MSCCCAAQENHVARNNIRKLTFSISVVLVKKYPPEKDLKKKGRKSMAFFLLLLPAPGVCTDMTKTKQILQNRQITSNILFSVKVNQRLTRSFSTHATSFYSRRRRHALSIAPLFFRFNFFKQTTRLKQRSLIKWPK